MPFRADSAGGPDVQKTVVVPQLQFSGLVETCPLLRRQVQFSDNVVDMPVGVQTTGFGQTVQKNVVPQLHFSDKVVDVHAVAVHRQGVDVPVIMQRRYLPQLRCLRFRSSPESVAILLCIRDGYYGGDEGFFDAFCVIFRAPLIVPELTASFSSFRALTAVSAQVSRGAGVAGTRT